MVQWLLLGVGVLLTLCTAVFVAAEFSLVAVDRNAAERAAADGDRRAAGVVTAVRNLSTQLSGAQVGITITTLVLGFLVEPSLATLLHGPLTGIGLDDDAAEGVAVVIALAIATAFSMVFGELLPQNLAISEPLRTARIVAGPQRIFTAAVRPLITLLNGSANRILHVFGIEPQEELSAGRSAEELAWLVRHSAEAGTLDPEVARLITRSLGFSTRTAADVMTPRVRTLVVQQDDHASDVVALARRTGHSRFPVVDGDLDDVVGVVHLKAAVGVPRDRRDDVPVGALMVEALRVPDSVRLDPLLVELRQLGLQLAVVADEYGGTAGVVTLEDLVEELVGEVADEHDRSRPDVVHRKDGSWWVPGLLRPDEVRERTGLDMPDGTAYETMGGLLMAELGRVPRIGDVIRVDGARLRVERMDGRRVDRIGITPIGPPARPATSADDNRAEDAG